MNWHLHVPVAEVVLQNMAKGFLSKMTLPFQTKKRVNTIQVSAGLSPEFSAAVEFLPMSLPRAKKIVQSDCFSAPFFQKICRLCVLLGKKMHLTRPELAGKNIFRCSYTHYAGTLKPAIMSRKLSGLCAVIWCADAKALR